MNIIQEQLATVRERYPSAFVERTPEGMMKLTVPGVPIGGGWSRDEVTLVILIPNAYPHAKPDCFYADQDLTLAGSREPSNSGLQVLHAKPYRWFSWHLSTWDAVRDGLDQFVRFCEQRLKEVR